MNDKSKRHLKAVKEPKDSLLKKTVKGIKNAGASASHYLGLDIEEPTSPSSNCGEEGCSIPMTHRHVQKGFGPQVAGEVPVGTKSFLDDRIQQAVSRPEHFEHGKQEATIHHINEGREIKRRKELDNE